MCSAHVMYFGKSLNFPCASLTLVCIDKLIELYTKGVDLLSVCIFDAAVFQVEMLEF